MPFKPSPSPLLPLTALWKNGLYPGKLIAILIMFEEAEEIEEGGNLDPLGRILGFWGIFFDFFVRIVLLGRIYSCLSDTGEFL